MTALQNRKPYEDMIDVGSLRPLRLVCRYWNNVLLHTPNLWSTILDLPRDHSRPFSPTNRPVFSSYIHLCQNSPLSFYSHNVSDSGHEFLREHGSRIRAVHIAYPFTVHGDIHEHLLSTPLPDLEVCSFDISLHGYVVLQESSVYTRLFFGGTPQLRELHLSGDVYLLPKGSFPLLETFTITGKISVTGTGLTPPALGPFLDFFSRAPRLRTVELTRLVEHGTTASLEGWNGGRVQLPRLTSITLTEIYDCLHGRFRTTAAASSTFWHALLSHIIAPNMRDVEIWPLQPSKLRSCVAVIPGSERRASHLWLSFVRGVECLHLACVDLRTAQRTFLEIGCANKIGAQSSDRQVPLLLEVTGAYLAQIPMFQNIRNLHVANPTGNELNALFKPAGAAFLANLPNLECLVVVGAVRDDEDSEPEGASPFTLSDVITSLEVPEGLDAGAVCCPRLAVLGIEHLERAPAASVDDSALVGRMAQSRMAAGCPLTRILVRRVPSGPVEEYSGEGTLTNVHTHPDAERMIRDLWSGGRDILRGTLTPMHDT
ncbi:hypothetical protein C8Q76DRAFT_798124 [Earliella scabrosa]|nr:hypothetical protein C8Q76DRAFT_798124 [Earliella scabrosa]